AADRRRDAQRLATTWRSTPAANLVFHPDLSRSAWEASLRGALGNSTGGADAMVTRRLTRGSGILSAFAQVGWANDSAGIDDLDTHREVLAGLSFVTPVLYHYPLRFPVAYLLVPIVRYTLVPLLHGPFELFANQFGPANDPIGFRTRLAASANAAFAR